MVLLLVREKGLEPPRIAAQDPKSCVSTNSTTRALIIFCYEINVLVYFTLVVIITASDNIVNNNSFI